MMQIYIHGCNVSCWHILMCIYEWDACIVEENIIACTKWIGINNTYTPPCGWTQVLVYITFVEGE